MAMEEVEFERVGDEGRTVGPRGAGGGEGATECDEEVRWWWPAPGKGDGGAIDVGVAIGVFCEDETAVLFPIVGFLAVATSPEWI